MRGQEEPAHLQVPLFSASPSVIAVYFAMLRSKHDHFSESQFHDIIIWQDMTSKLTPNLDALLMWFIYLMAIVFWILPLNTFVKTVDRPLNNELRDDPLMKNCVWLLIRVINITFLIVWKTRH